MGNGDYIPQYGFPMNMLLPKGKAGGMPFTFYVIVHKNDFKQQLGFPFDRKINYLDFFVPNMYFKDVVITQFVDMDIHSDMPLNNFWYNKVIPMHSIRVPLNTDYYTNGRLDDVFVHTSDIYHNVWYMKYLRMMGKGTPAVHKQSYERYGKVILDKNIYHGNVLDRDTIHRDTVIDRDTIGHRDTITRRDWIKY